MNLYVGTSGFSYAAWKGKFYPERLPARQMLGFYGEHFRAVEINQTFRTMPDVSALETWEKAVPRDFRFALKAPMQITHRRRLKDSGDLAVNFVANARALKSRLGPLLFQLPPNAKKDVERLSSFLAALPRRCRAAFEFRHPSWFDGEVFKLLRKRRAALCIADAEGDLEVPFVATTNWGYLRLRRSHYSRRQLGGWLNRIRQQNWRDAFVFFRHEDEARGPKMAQQLLALAARS
jgi:uncharacterized protein YecE (DUF72 family)